jgi:predicted DNA-binding transcriptional regulator YafY
MANYIKIEKLKNYLNQSRNLEDIANHLEVSTRTAYRYIDTLKDELILDKSNSEKKLYKVKSEKDILLSHNERKTLECTIQQLSDQGDLESAKQMSELVKRLQKAENNNSTELNLLGPNKYFEIINGPFSSSRLSTQSKSVKTLQRAMENSQTVKIRYYSLSQYEKGKEGKLSEVAPYKIVLRSGRLYLIAKPTDFLAKNSARIYLFSRIQQIQSTSNYFSQPSKLKIDDFYKYTFGQWAVHNEEPQKITLHTQELWLKRHIEESHFNPKANIIADPQGGWNIQLELYITQDFVSWIVGNTPEIFVKEPVALRNQVNEKRSAKTLCSD